MIFRFLSLQWYFAPLFFFNPVLSFVCWCFTAQCSIDYLCSDELFGGFFSLLLFLALFVVVASFLEIHWYSRIYYPFSAVRCVSASRHFLSGFAAVYHGFVPLTNSTFIGIAIGGFAHSRSEFLSSSRNRKYWSHSRLSLCICLKSLLSYFWAVIAFLLLGFRRVREEIQQEEELRISE